MNVLAIGAHFDDVELGCGGSLARHVQKGDQVFVYVATVSGYSNQNKKEVRSSQMALIEGKNAMKVLGVKDLICGRCKTLEIEFTDSLNIEILKIINAKKIDLVYTHWIGDIHHDHLAVARAALHSCRHVPRLMMYRSNWYHSTSEFRGNFYIDITSFWEIKEKAIRAHISEIDRTGEKWLNFFQNEAKNAGQRIGVPMAEVFEIVKYLDLN
jgi:LmbE family N-acetylglucosaminyl deacetylase